MAPTALQSAYQVSGLPLVAFIVCEMGATNGCVNFVQFSTFHNEESPSATELVCEEDSDFPGAAWKLQPHNERPRP